MIGRKFTNPHLSKDIKDLLYDVVEKNGRPSIKVQINGKDKYFSPEEITSKILEKLKTMAETHINRPVKQAVISVPSYFDDDQRQATKDAAQIAGLNVLRLINEPRAAGIGYRLDALGNTNATCRDEGEYMYLFLNVGAKELDVALESIDCGIFETFSRLEDKTVGGISFEKVLLSHAVDHFSRQYDFDITQDIGIMESLKLKVQEAEGKLSTEKSASIIIPAFDGSNSLSMFVTQTELQKLSQPLIDRSLEMIKQVLKDAKIQKKEVNGIILTGDPVHVAKFQASVEHYLERKAYTSEDVLPELAIVRGASLQGYILSAYNEDMCTLSFPEVTRLSLGIETSPGIFTKVIPRLTIIPKRAMRVFVNVADNQEKVVIKVLEGERAIASKNGHIGTLELAGFPPTSKGGLDIEVVFEIDVDEVLTVSAREKKSGKEVKLVTSTGRDRYDLGQIEAILVEAENYHEADKLVLEQLSLEFQDETEKTDFGVIAKQIPQKVAE